MRKSIATFAMAAVMLSACGNNPAESPAGDDGNSSLTGEACEDDGERLPLTGLCQQEAAALLIDPDGAPEAAPDGCRWTIRETRFAIDMLLYRSLQCGSDATELELAVGNHMSELVYVARSDDASLSDANDDPMVLGMVFAGMPGGRARALWETRDSIGDEGLAGRCDIREPYQPEGLPKDALIVDVQRSAADLERDDAAPLCGPFGYNPAGGSIDFWRPHQGFAWFFRLGTDIWDVDPGSFTLIQKSAGRQALPATR